MAAGVNRLSKTFVWILMGLLMLGLAGFGAVNMAGTVRTVATAGDHTVSVDEYARALQREIRAVEAQTGQPLQMSQATAMGLDQIVLARLIAIASLDHEVTELGVSIGDENLQQEILRIPEFQGMNGDFDREAYRFTLEQTGRNEAGFEADLRAEIARTLVQGAVMSGIEMPATMTDTIAEYVGARRSFTVARLTAEALETPIADPDDDRIRQFYEANQDRFTLPLTKRLTYALLSPEMLLDQVEVDEASVRRLYDERETSYNLPERRLVERLVFADDEAAQGAMAQLEVGGTTFEQLVDDRDLSLSDIDLGDVAAEDLGAAAEAVFGADVGEVVGPLPSDLGPALFRVNGTLAARVTEYEDVAAELRDERAAEQARRLIESRAEAISDLLAGGATLEDLAAETSMQTGSIDWTSDSTEDIAAYDEFRAAAEAITENDFPEVAFLEDGSIFAMRLDEVLQPRPEPLDQARDRVAAAWRQAETESALAAQAATLVTQLAVDGDFTATGLPHRVENGLTRSAYLDDTPDGFMTQVFEMEPGDIRVITGDGAALIVRLNEVLPAADTPELGELRGALSEQLNQALAQSVFDIYVRDTQTRARPTLDQRALTAVQTSFQ